MGVSAYKIQVSRTHGLILATALVLSASPSHSQERGLELGAYAATTFLQELDVADVGFGGRVGYRVHRFVTLDFDLGWYPADVPDDVALTASRLEGLFGARIGPRFDGFSLFGKARPGFVRFGAAPEPVACIEIFPPPLGCVLAGGETVFALDLGGGIELYPTDGSLVRIDVSNLLLRYPGPAFNRDGETFFEGGFWGGNLRLAIGAGLRF